MTLHTAHFKINMAHCTLHIVHCTLNTEHCKLHTAYYKLHTGHWTLNCTQCTPPPVLCAVILPAVEAPALWLSLMFLGTKYTQETSTRNMATMCNLA